MSEQVDYLQQYVRDLRILDTQSLTATDKQIIPLAWQELLALEGAARVKASLQRWAPFYTEFQQVIDYLRVNLLQVDVIYSHRGYSLLYAVKAETGTTMYYEGLLPGTAPADAAVETLFAQTPEKLQQFYRELHNGWVYFASRSMGLSPLEDMFVMGKQDWGILAEIGPSPIDLAHSLAVYTNGMGGYVCLEFADTARAHIWYSDDKPTLDIDFWPFVDSWTAIGFEG